MTILEGTIHTIEKWNNVIKSGGDIDSANLSMLPTIAYNLAIVADALTRIALHFENLDSKKGEKENG